LKTVAEFEIKYCQFLDAAGSLAAGAPPLASDTAELLKMYRVMTLVRAFDTKAINLQRTGKLGTYASCLGHEAAHVGVAAAMHPEDVLVPVYREFGSQIWRGRENVDHPDVLGWRRARLRLHHGPRGLPLVRTHRHANAPRGRHRDGDENPRTKNAAP